jgi:hypothetical protein
MSKTLLKGIMQSTPVISNQKTLGGKRKLEAVTAYLEPDLKAVLEEWAKSESRSLSSLVVYLLSQAAKERQQDQGAA